MHCIFNIVEHQPQSWRCRSADLLRILISWLTVWPEKKTSLMAPNQANNTGRSTWIRSQLPSLLPKFGSHTATILWALFFFIIARQATEVSWRHMRWQRRQWCRKGGQKSLAWLAKGRYWRSSNISGKETQKTKMAKSQKRAAVKKAIFKDFTEASHSYLKRYRHWWCFSMTVM